MAVFQFQDQGGTEFTQYRFRPAQGGDEDAEEAARAEEVDLQAAVVEARDFFDESATILKRNSLNFETDGGVYRILFCWIMCSTRDMLH